MDAFMKDALNVKPVLLKQNAPQMDAFMKDVLNVKPVLLKQNVPQMDAFMKDVLNVKPVLLKQHAPQTDAFITKGSVSYLSSPCFSTIIGGIGGPARGKRSILGVIY